MNSRILNLVSFASAAVIGAAAISAIPGRPAADRERASPRSIAAEDGR